MKPKKKIPKGWRKLRKGEIVKLGDRISFMQQTAFKDVIVGGWIEREPEVWIYIRRRTSGGRK